MLSNMDYADQEHFDNFLIIFNALQNNQTAIETHRKPGKLQEAIDPRKSTRKKISWLTTRLNTWHTLGTIEVKNVEEQGKFSKARKEKSPE